MEKDKTIADPDFEDTSFDDAGFDDEGFDDAGFDEEGFDDDGFDDVDFEQAPLSNVVTEKAEEHEEKEEKEEEKPQDEKEEAKNEEKVEEIVEQKVEEKEKVQEQEARKQSTSLSLTLEDDNSFYNLLKMIKKLTKKTHKSQKHSAQAVAICTEITLEINNDEKLDIPLLNDKTAKNIQTHILDLCLKSKGFNFGVSLLKTSVLDLLQALYRYDESKFAPVLTKDMSSTLKDSVSDLYNIMSREGRPGTMAKITFIIQLLSGLYESAANFMPTIKEYLPMLFKLWKLNHAQLKIVIILFLERYIKATNRRIDSNWNDIMKFVHNACKEPIPSLRAHAGDCLGAMIHHFNTSNLESKDTAGRIEQSLMYCYKHLDDVDSFTRLAFAKSLASLYHIVCNLEKSIAESTRIDTKEDEKKKATSTFSSIFRKKSKIFTFRSIVEQLLQRFHKSSSTNRVKESISYAMIDFFSLIPRHLLQNEVRYLLNMLMQPLNSEQTYATSSDKLLVQHYIGYIIRNGIIFNLNDQGKLNVTLIICTEILQGASNCHYITLCLLRECALIFKLLGEQIHQDEVRDKILEAILSCQRSKSSYVRYVGALCMRSLAESCPEKCGNLVSSLLNMLHMIHAEIATASKTDSATKLAFATSVHGHANALAALISVFSNNKLSVSYTLASSAFHTAVLLYSYSDEMSDISVKRQEACWTLVSSTFSLSNYWVLQNLEKVKELWDQCLNSQFGLLMYNNGDQIVIAEKTIFTLRKRASALMSLASFLKYCPELVNEELSSTFIKYLINTISILIEFPSKYHTSRSLMTALSMIKLYLFKSFLALPDHLITTNTNKPFLNKLTQIVFSELSYNLKASLLTTIYSSENQNYQYMKYPFFGSESHHINVHASTVAYPSCVLENSQKFFKHSVIESQSLFAEVLNSKVKVIGKLFLLHKPPARKQIMSHIVKSLKVSQDVENRDRILQVQFWNANAIVYQILTELVESQTLKQVSLKNAGPNDYLQQISSIVNLSLGYHSKKVRFIAAYSMELLCQLLDTSVVHDIVKKCRDQISLGTKSVAGYAIVLGRVSNQLRAGMSGNTYFTMVSSLITLCRSPDHDIQRSAFRSLCQCIDASSISFNEHVVSVLQLLSMQIFSKHKSYNEKRVIYIGCIRVLRALIGLGPDIVTNPDFIQLFNIFLHKYMASPHPLVRIEAVHLIQRAAVLCPNLLNIPLVFKSLITYLKSDDYFELKQLAASCLTVLVLMRQDTENIFTLQDLFDELAMSSPHAIMRQESLEIKELIYKVCELKLFSPSVWLEVVAKINAKPLPDQEPKEEEEVFYNEGIKTFSLKCLKRVIDQYQEPYHIDPHVALPENMKDEDRLCSLITKLIHVCRDAVTNGLSQQQEVGIKLLITIVKKWDAINDLQTPNESILTQHVIHFGSAIRTGFDKNAPPYLMQVSASLLSIYVTSRMVSNDEAAINRVLNFITEKLPQLKEMHFSQYGEIAATLVKLYFLHCLADITIKADHTKNLPLLTLLEPYANDCINYWTLALKDFAYLTLKLDSSNQYIYLPAVDSEEEKRYNGEFFDEGTEIEVFEYYEETYPVIINALTRVSRVKSSIHDPVLLAGLSIRTFDKMLGSCGGDVSISFATLTSKKRDQLYNCLEAMTKLIGQSEFNELKYSHWVMYEFSITLLQLISRFKDIQFNMKCLRYVKALVKTGLGKDFFKRLRDKKLEASRPNTLVGVDATQYYNILIHLCLRSTELCVSNLFDKTNQMECFSPTHEQISIIKKSFSSLRTLLKRFPNEISQSNRLSCILFSIHRVCKYTDTDTGFEAITALVEHALPLISKLEQKENSKKTAIWKDSFTNLILDILKSNTPIRSHQEMKLLFAAYACITPFKTQFSQLHNIFIGILNEIDFELMSSKHFLRGVFEGILYLSQHGHSKLTTEFLSLLNPYLFEATLRIVRQPPPSNPIPEDDRCVSYSLNILLASHSLLNGGQHTVVANPQGSVENFVILLVPLLAESIQYYAASHHMAMLKLVMECVERLIRGNPESFKKAMSNFPPRIQESFAQGTAALKSNTESKSASQPKAVRKIKTRKKASKLSFNFVSKK